MNPVRIDIELRNFNVGQMLIEDSYRGSALSHQLLHILTVMLHCIMNAHVTILHCYDDISLAHASYGHCIPQVLSIRDLDS